MIRTVFAAAALMMTLLIAGCSAPPQPTTDPLGAAPSDLFIDVTIIAKPVKGAAISATETNLEVHLRPARYVLFADGTLRYGPDPNSERGVNWLPPIARMLTREQTAHVWSLARQLGLADPEQADPIINFKLVNELPGERIYLADFRGNGRRWNFIRRAPAEAPPDPALAKFVDTLAELAFVDQADDVAGMVAPRRYDFGPDPYARYRQSEATP